MRCFLVVEYDGTGLSGWQRQKNGASVQETLEAAAARALGAAVKITGSGRTDAGVHAQGQVCHLDYSGPVPPERIALAMNAFLPSFVSVRASGAAPAGFHAVRSAKKKTYVYRFFVSPVPRPLLERYAARVPIPLDGDAMARAAAEFVGEHDFAAFCASGSSAKSTVRTVYSARVGREGEVYALEVTGGGFLYNMVRIMAGTVIAAGEGRIGEADVRAALCSGERKRAGKTAPAAGLCLKSVDYGDALFLPSPPFCGFSAPEGGQGKLFSENESN